MTAPTPQNPGLTNWLLIASLGVIWGAAFMLVRIALDGFDPWQVAAGRVTIGALCLWTIGAAMGQGLRSLPSRKAVGFAAAIGGIAIALPVAMLSWGQQFVPSAFAGVAMGVVPLLVLPLAAIFSKEEGIGPRRILGFITGFIGLVILLGPEALNPTGAALETWGRLACIASAGCYALGSIITRRAPKMPPIAFATATLMVGAAILLPIALIKEGVPTQFPAGPGMALLGAALFPTALAAVIRVRVITTAGSVFMSLTSYQVPVWSVIFGVTLMNEALPPQLFVALALILLGIAISQSRALGNMIFASRR